MELHHHVYLAAAGCSVPFVQGEQTKNVLKLPFGGYIEHNERPFLKNKSKYPSRCVFLFSKG